VAARFGGGIGLFGGATNVLIDDCVFHELGYSFSQPPMSAASLAGAGVAIASCHGLTISRCDFSRLAVACDFSKAGEIDGVEIAGCTFHDAVVWPVGLPATAQDAAPSGLVVHGCDVANNAQFDFGAWTGYGSSPRVELAIVQAGAPFTLSVGAIASPSPTFQWQKNGVPVAGATGATFSLGAVTLADSGLYTAVASNGVGSASGNSVVLVVTPYDLGNLSISTSAPTIAPATLSAPVITTQPVSQTVTASTNVAFTVAATDAQSFQWKKNGEPISGATGSTLSLNNVTTADSATYSVVVANSAGSVASNAATLTVIQATSATTPAEPDVAVTSGPGKKLMVVGANPATLNFNVTGTTVRKLLIRAVGPTLRAFGHAGALADPKLEIYAGSVLLSQNDDWGGSDVLRTLSAQAGAFPLSNPQSKDAAVIVGLPPGSYTAIASGVNGATGAVLIEIYEIR
jgi:hypothetical protein